MILVIVASPVRQFDIAVVDDSGKSVCSTQAFYCQVRGCIKELVEQYPIESAQVYGPKSYTSEIVKELQAFCSFPVNEGF